MAVTSPPAPDPATDKPPRARRRIPVSLRLFAAMLGLVFVIGAVWIGTLVYRRQVIIREIQQARGTAEFVSDAPRWLHEWVTDDWLSAFDRILEVTLPFSETLDASTKHLLAMRPLPRLYIEGGPPVHELIREGRLDEVRSILTRHHILLFSCEADRLDETPLRVAVREGKFDIQQRAEIVRFLLEQGSEVDAPDFGGSTPLYRAAHPQIVKLLLDHGADMRLDGPNSGVLDAVADVFTRCDAEHQENWLEIAHLLRAAGAECNIVSACYLDDLARVRQLLKSGRPPNIQDALRAAATWGRTEIVKLLLAAGAHPNDVRHDKPVVYDAIRHPDVLRIFFDRGVRVDASYKRWGLNGWTLLHEAAENGAIESAQLLLSRGLPVDVEGESGKTPLHVAAESGKVAVVKLLLGEHANFNAETIDGYTAISYATSEFELPGKRKLKSKPSELQDVTELLLAAGARLDLFAAIVLGRTAAVRQMLIENLELTTSRDRRGRSALYRAVDVDQPDIVEVLLAAGADIDAGGDYEDAAALHRAARLRRPAIARILIEHNADVNKTDAFGRIPLHWAADELEPQVVRLLLAAGAKSDAEDEIGQTPLELARRPRMDALTEAQQRDLIEIIQLLREPEESVSR
jgi:ankyrin repeat protein